MRWSVLRILFAKEHEAGFASDCIIEYIWAKVHSHKYPEIELAKIIIRKTSYTQFAILQY
jgi:hypothetical protein